MYPYTIRVQPREDQPARCQPRGHSCRDSDDYSTDYTNYTGVFGDVVEPSESDAMYQPGLIKQMGKNVPALRIDGDDAGIMRWQRNRDTRKYVEICRDTPKYVEIRQDTPRDATCSEGSLCKTSARTCFEKIGEGGVIRHSIFVPFVSIFIQSLCCVCYVYHTCYLSLCFCSYLSVLLSSVLSVVMYLHTIWVISLITRLLLQWINIWIAIRLFLFTAELRICQQHHLFIFELLCKNSRHKRIKMLWVYERFIFLKLL